MSMDAAHLGEGPLADERADFILDPREVEMGAEAVASYLASLKEGDGRRSAEDALHTLALLFTDGVCDAREFPWQQVKAYHGAASMGIGGASRPKSGLSRSLERCQGCAANVAPRGSSRGEGDRSAGCVADGPE